MPLSYPLSISAFQDKLKISSVELFLSNPRQVDRTAGGAQNSASLGNAVWHGMFTIPPTNSRADAAEIDALLSALDRAGSSFLVYDPSKPAPASGGTSTATISALNGSDRRLMTISGGPTLAPGDLLSFTYGSNPTRYSLHRIVTLSGSTLEVTPFIPVGATTSATVTFVKPVMKAVLRPDPNYGTHRPVVSGGKSFSFVQTLR